MLQAILVHFSIILIIILSYIHYKVSCTEGCVSTVPCKNICDGNYQQVLGLMFSNGTVQLLLILICGQLYVLLCMHDNAVSRGEREGGANAGV